MKKRAIYPGTFDPITNGHLDLVKRAVRIFNEVIIAVAPSHKKKPLFTIQERLKMINLAVTGIKEAKVEAFSGLLGTYVRKRRGDAILRGLGAISDCENELQMAHGAMAESLPVRIEGDNLVTVSDSVSIAVILLFDAPTADIVRFLGAIMAVRRSQNRYTHLLNTPIYKSLFNGFCRGITVFLAWHAYQFLNGLAPNPVITNFGLIGLLGLVAVYFAVDQILFAILFSFLSKTSFIHEINKKLLAIKQLLALTPLGVIFAGLYNWQGILPVVFLVGPFLFTRQSIEQAHRRLEKQKKIEEELRSSEEKFSKAFLASPMAIILQRVSYLKYVDVNEGFTRITGYSREEALEHTINELNLYPDKEISAQMRKLFREQGFLRDFEIPFRRKSGEIGYGLVWGEPIEINGEAMYIGGTVSLGFAPVPCIRFRIR